MIPCYIATLQCIFGLFYELCNTTQQTWKLVQVTWLLDCSGELRSTFLVHKAEEKANFYTIFVVPTNPLVGLILQAGPTPFIW